jgi:hypothetical protein
MPLQVVGGWMRILILCFSCGSLGPCTAGVRAHFSLEQKQRKAFGDVSLSMQQMLLSRVLT